MKITIENTTKLVQVTDRDGGPSILCRVWEGQTKSGVRVQCLIPRIAALAGEDLSQFERELTETRAPSADVQAFPLRLVL